MLSAQPWHDSCPIVRLSEGTCLPGDTVLQPGLSCLADGGYVLGVPGIARYDIRPESVTVHSLEQADPQAVQLFLWGSAAGAVLHLHGMLPLHGSTVQLPNGTAAVFCGHSGAGKSTTVAALGRRGLSCLADDVSAIRLDESGQAWVYPGLPRTKLWGNALSLLDMAQGQQIREGVDKYYVDMPVCVEPLRLTRLYELDVKQGAGLTVLPIVGMGRVTTLLSQTYRPLFVDTLGLQAAHMARVARLAPQLKMVRISRPRNDITLHEIADLVMRA
jgi:hypothetical protein